MTGSGTGSLQVWINQSRVGELRMERGELVFAYATDWLAAADARPLSVALPLQEQAFDHLTTRAWFAGLLPEGNLRKALSRQLQVSEGNDFALLDALAGECAGAVSLLAEGHKPADDSTQDVLWLDDQALAQEVEQLPTRPLGNSHDGVRISLAGVQDKLAVVVDGGRIGLPRNGTPSTHILKPAIAGYADTVLNEAFCLQLASKAGLQAAASFIRVINGKPVLLVQRYDRLMAATSVVRAHQEDFCQALGIVPELKYQNEGGPALAQCFDLVRRATNPPARHLEELLRYVIFNALIGNNDAHGKNFSLLSDRKGGRRLAPLYDAMCLSIYAGLSQKMAMKIGSKYAFDQIHRRHWEALAAEAGFSPKLTLKLLSKMAGTLPGLAGELAQAPPFSGNPTIASIVGEIQQRAAMTLRRLALAG